MRKTVNGSFQKEGGMRGPDESMDKEALKNEIRGKDV